MVDGTLIKQTVIAVLIGTLLGGSGGLVLKAAPVHAFDVTITVGEGVEVIEVATAPDGYTLVTDTVVIAPDEPAEMVTPDGDVIVQVEAGTVESYVVLRYETLFEEQIPELSLGFVATEALFDLSLVNVDPESGEDPVLLKPITITLTLNQDVIAQAQENDLLLVILHYHDGQWTVLETTVDLENATAQAQVDSLSIFALAYQTPIHRSHVEVDKDDGANPIDFGDVFLGEAVPEQFTVNLTNAAIIENGTAAASYQIVLSGGNLLFCPELLPDPVFVTCLTIIKAADSDTHIPVDTPDCAELTEGTDESDTWTVTLRVPDGTSSTGDYDTDIIVEADDTGAGPNHGDPCA